MKESGSSANFTDVHGKSPESTLLTYTHTASIVAGSSYIFRVRAKNVYGYGDWSTELTIKASSVPGIVSIPAVSVVDVGNNVGGIQIAWNEPTTNSEVITAYEITISDAAGTPAFHIPSTCDGT